DGSGAGRARQRRRVREDRAGAAEEAPVLSAPPPPVFLAAPEVVGDDRRVLVGRRERRVVLSEERDHRVAELGERDVEPARLVALLHVAPPLAARTDPDHVDRSVAHAVVAAAREVLGRELPVTGDEPLVDPADRLRAALTAIPRVEEEVEVELVAADVLGERRSRGVPGGPDRTLVVLHPRDLDEPPAAPVELGAVGVLREGHADQRAVGRVAPAVIRALELHRVALVVAAHLHAPVPAGIQKHANPSGAVAAEDDRLLAHARREKVARLRNLALVADEEPGAREHALLLLTIDLIAHEDLAADDAALDVDQVLQGPRLRAGHARLPPRLGRAPPRPPMVGQDPSAW